MKYKVYISEVWTYSTVIDAESQDEAEVIASDISMDLGIDDMSFCDGTVEVELA